MDGFIEKGNMQESTTYLIIPQLEGLKLLPKGILCLAAGGSLPVDRKIRLVIVGCNNDQEVIRDVKRYTEARRMVKEIEEWPQLPECLPPLFLKETTAMADNGLFDTDGNNHSLWPCQFSPSIFEPLDFKEDDQFVVISSTEDMRSLSLHNALAALPWMTKHKDHIQDVCMVAYEQGKEKKRQANVFRAFRWFQDSPIVFTGIRDDAYRKGMTIMETIASVVNACHNHLSGLPYHEENIAYTPDDLPSRQARESIMRMKFLYDIRKATTSSNLELEKWRKSFDVSKNDGLWRSGMPFNAINDMLDMFNEFITNIPSDHFSFSQNENSGLFSKLNNLPKLMLKGLTQQSKRIIQLGKLLEMAANEHPQALHPTPTYSSVKRMEICDEVFEMALMSESPSLTAPWVIMSLAFSKESLNLVYAKRLRSACIDLWELFYRHTKTEIVQVLKIEEYDMKRMNKDFLQLLCQTKEGKRLNRERWLFKIRGKGVSAWSSSLTGFAIKSLPQNPICIGNKCYFSESKELSQRTTDIQDFIFKYVSSIDVFDEDFKSYVNEQLPQQMRHEAQSQGRNLHKLYPKFRHHIGVEAIEKK